MSLDFDAQGRKRKRGVCRKNKTHDTSSLSAQKKCSQSTCCAACNCATATPTRAPCDFRCADSCVGLPCDHGWGEASGDQRRKSACVTVVLSAMPTRRIVCAAL